MKNFLFIYLFITLSIVVNSCEEGFKDESSVFTLVLKEVTAVPSLTTDNTPDYTFSSNIAVILHTEDYVLQVQQLQAKEIIQLL